MLTIGLLILLKVIRYSLQGHKLSNLVDSLRWFCLLPIPTKTEPACFLSSRYLRFQRLWRSSDHPEPYRRCQAFDVTIERQKHWHVLVQTFLRPSHEIPRWRSIGLRACRGAKANSHRWHIYALQDAAWYDRLRCGHDHARRWFHAHWGVQSIARYCHWQSSDLARWVNGWQKARLLLLEAARRHWKQEASFRAWPDVREWRLCDHVHLKADRKWSQSR